MGKYDFALDMDTHNNSLAMIISHIHKSGGRILEFGPANGRLTRYLHDERGFDVDIVEIDEKAGREAAEYADTACLGPKDGDIDAGFWRDRLAGKQYDYIIFADVLEHLRKPGDALDACFNLLKQGGSILVSVPNIAHNAILVGLMADVFQYTETGLLDNTHIHFFTRHSFKVLVETFHYKIVSEEATYLNVGECEVPVSYDLISSEATRVLKARPLGRVYQYIFELKRSEDSSNIPSVVRLEEFSEYTCECYYGKEKNETLSEYKKIIYPLVALNGGTHKHIEFNMEMLGEIRDIRIDPLNASCVICVKDMYTLDTDGEMKYVEYTTNGLQYDSLIVFENSDPQIRLKFVPENIKTIVLDFVYICFDDGMVSAMAKVIDELENKIHELSKEKELLQEKRCLQNLCEQFGGLMRRVFRI